MTVFLKEELFSNFTTSGKHQVISTIWYHVIPMLVPSRKEPKQRKATWSTYHLQILNFRNINPVICIKY